MTWFQRSCQGPRATPLNCMALSSAGGPGTGLCSFLMVLVRTIPFPLPLTSANNPSFAWSWQVGNNQTIPTNRTNELTKWGPRDTKKAVRVRAGAHPIGISKAISWENFHLEEQKSLWQSGRNWNVERNCAPETLWQAEDSQLQNYRKIAVRCH